LLISGGIEFVSLFLLRELLSPKEKHLLHKHQQERQMCVLNVKARESKNNIGTATTVTN
jgi:hypothetical protein